MEFGALGVRGGGIDGWVLEAQRVGVGEILPVGGVGCGAGGKGRFVGLKEVDHGEDVAGGGGGVGCRGWRWGVELGMEDGWMG